MYFPITAHDLPVSDVASKSNSGDSGGELGAVHQASSWMDQV